MNNLSSFILLTLLILLFCFKSLEISDKNLVDSLNEENVPVSVALNDEEDNHIIEKRQRNRKQKKRRTKRTRRQLANSLSAIAAQIVVINQQLISLQAQVSNIATTTTTPAPTAGR